jgi:hypothetical protein
VDKRPHYRTPFNLTACLDRVADLTPLHRIEEILVWDIRDCVDEVALQVASGRISEARESTRALCHDVL